MKAPAPELREARVDEARIKKAIVAALPISITAFTLTNEVKLYMENVLSIFLRAAGQERLKNHITYCVHELAANAQRANIKRVYFSERNLDLSNSDDYAEGMKHFKEATQNNIAYYLRLQKEMDLYVRFVLQIRKNIIFIEIRNNARASRAELIRIHDRLARTRQYKNLEEALAHVLDDTEGAGLGLAILMLMLKKIGLDEDCFDLSVKGNETIARIVIPLAQIHLENVSALSIKIASSVSSLPQFPEHVLEMRKLLDDENVTMAEISKRMSSDPALAAGLLKTVNSARYMIGRRVNNLLDAVNIVGIKGIRNLLYSYETQRILGHDTEEKKRLWAHSHKAAFYAYQLAKNLGLKQEVIDDVYVSSLLHDIGKIVLSNIHPKLLEKIQRFAHARSIPCATFEDISSGLNHAEIGALVAENWNFPDSMVMAIRYHHNPQITPKGHQRLVQIVYLANMLCEYESADVTFEQFDLDALGSFDVSSKEELDALAARLSSGFNKELGGGK